MKRTDEIQTAIKILHQRIHAIILHAADGEDLISTPRIDLGLGPIHRFANAEDLIDAHCL